MERKQSDILNKQLELFKSKISNKDALFLEKNKEKLLKIKDLNNLPKNLSNEIKTFVKKNKEKYLSILRDPTKITHEELLRDREEFKTSEVLSNIQKNTKSKQLKKIISILRSNKRLLEKSSILRGRTFDGSGIGQSIVVGTFKYPNPQVFVKKFNGHKQISPFKMTPLPFEKDNRELFNTTVLHELIHSFTQYIVIIMENNANILSETEKKFYKAAKILHNKHLSKHKTNDPYLDSLDEFIAKTMTTDDPQYTGDKFSTEMTDLFKHLYQNNTRKIISLSHFLTNST